MSGGRGEAVARIRVTYGDTDQMGVVYYANYLRFFEIGRAEWLRAKGRAYRELESSGVLLPVIEAFVRYLAPARYDDELDIDAAPSDLRGASLRFRYAVRRHADGALLVDGHTVHACVRPDGRPRRIPDEIRQLIGGDEHGS